MITGTLVIPKAWRSELWGIILFFLFAICTVWLSKKLPNSIIIGELFSTTSYTVTLKLPLLWLFPFFTLIVIAWRIYDVRYVVDPKGIESLIGRISLQQRITRIRYEDIRSVETEQSLIERALNVGTVLVGTSGTSGVEIAMKGIAAPKEVQDMLQRERDARHKAALETVQKVLDEQEQESSDEQ